MISILFRIFVDPQVVVAVIFGFIYAVIDRLTVKDGHKMSLRAIVIVAALAYGVINGCYYDLTGQEINSHIYWAAAKIGFYYSILPCLNMYIGFLPAAPRWAFGDVFLITVLAAIVGLGYTIGFLIWLTILEILRMKYFRWPSERWGDKIVGGICGAFLTSEDTFAMAFFPVIWFAVVMQGLIPFPGNMFLGWFS